MSDMYDMDEFDSHPADFVYEPLRTFEVAVIWSEDTDEYVPALRIDGKEVWRGEARETAYKAYEAASKQSERLAA